MNAIPLTVFSPLEGTTDWTDCGSKVCGLIWTGSNKMDQCPTPHAPHQYRVQEKR